MPRRSQPRATKVEEQVAANVALLRAKNNWTLTQLATRMTRAGCPLNHTAVFKIESGKPRRRITVDELVGFATVFDCSVDELLTEPGHDLDRDLRRATTRWKAVFLEHAAVVQEFEERRLDLQNEIVRLATVGGRSARSLKPYLSTPWDVVGGDDLMAVLEDALKARRRG